MPGHQRWHGRNERFPRRGRIAATAVLVALLLIGLGAVGVGAEGLRVIVLTDVAGLGDKGFNDVCWQGVRKAHQDLGVSAQFLQAREQADYVPNLSLAAHHADIVVTLGFLYVDAVKRVAPQFPQTRFIHIEGDIPGDNVACFDFRSEHGGFLAGLVAGLYTRARQVGAVTGMDIPPVEAYVSGFRAGIATAEKARGEAITTRVVSAGSFNDPVKGKSLAQALIQQGVDVIFRIAGNTGVGVFEAVKQSPEVALIAEDLDQDAVLPGRILTSTLKRMDLAVYNAIKSIADGRFQAGHVWLGAPEGAMDITAMTFSRDRFRPQDLARIDRARELLRTGKLEIPNRAQDLKSFTAPAL